jgi:single stranded DNA-binding protein
MTIEVAVTGRLGAAPVRRRTNAGKPMVTFSLAVSAGSTETEWVNCSAFERLAEELPPDLGKGEQVYIEGRLRLNRWENAEGQRANLAVTATYVLVLGRIGRRRRKLRVRKPADAQVPLEGTNVVPLAVDDDPGWEAAS